MEWHSLPGVLGRKDDKLLGELSFLSFVLLGMSTLVAYHTHV